ncbi:unnamed protein product [Amoebophrya sp. A120]|nr:unnamed protein product [Amoebophrya sp. A120]|eukprot:GSA120T00018446001.1
MGVHGLWDLLSPAGTTCDLKSLRHQTVAVDASIWMFHFVKAIRDQEGNMVDGAHILGFFRRIVRLLHLGIKPIFVFDGPPPEVKKRTLNQRRLQREQGGLNLQKVTEKLFRNLLREEVLRQEEEIKSSAEDGDGDVDGDARKGREGGENDKRSGRTGDGAAPSSSGVTAGTGTKQLLLPSATQGDGAESSSSENSSSVEDEEDDLLADDLSPATKKRNAKAARNAQKKKERQERSNKLLALESSKKKKPSGNNGNASMNGLGSASSSATTATGKSGSSRTTTGAAAGTARQRQQQNFNAKRDDRELLIAEDDHDSQDEMNFGESFDSKLNRQQGGKSHSENMHEDDDEEEEDLELEQVSDLAWERRKKQRGYGLGVSVGQANLSYTSSVKNGGNNGSSSSAAQPQSSHDVQISDEQLKKYLLKMPQNVVQHQQGDSKGYEIEGPDGKKRLVTLPLGTLIDPEVFDKLDPMKRYETLTNLIDAWMTETRVKAMECRHAREAFSNVQLETFYRHIRTNKLLEETKLELAKARAAGGSSSSSAKHGAGLSSSAASSGLTLSGSAAAPGLLGESTGITSQHAGETTGENAGNLASWLKLRPIAAGFASTLRGGGKGSKGKGKMKGGGGKAEASSPNQNKKKNFFWRNDPREQQGVNSKAGGPAASGSGKKGKGKEKGGKKGAADLDLELDIEDMRMENANHASSASASTAAKTQTGEQAVTNAKNNKRNKYQQAVCYGQDETSTMTFSSMNVSQMLRLDDATTADVSTPTAGHHISSSMKRRRLESGSAASTDAFFHGSATALSSSMWNDTLFEQDEDESSDGNDHHKRRKVSSLKKDHSSKNEEDIHDDALLGADLDLWDEQDQVDQKRRRSSGSSDASRRRASLHQKVENVILEEDDPLFGAFFDEDETGPARKSQASVDVEDDENFVELPAHAGGGVEENASRDPLLPDRLVSQQENATMESCRLESSPSKNEFPEEGEDGPLQSQADAGRTRHARSSSSMSLSAFVILGKIEEDKDIDGNNPEKEMNSELNNKNKFGEQPNNAEGVKAVDDQSINEIVMEKNTDEGAPAQGLGQKDFSPAQFSVPGDLFEKNQKLQVEEKVQTQLQVENDINVDENYAVEQPEKKQKELIAAPDAASESAVKHANEAAENKIKDGDANVTTSTSTGTATAENQPSSSTAAQVAENQNTSQLSLNKSQFSISNAVATSTSQFVSAGSSQFSAFKVFDPSQFAAAGTSTSTGFGSFGTGGFGANTTTASSSFSFGKFPAFGTGFGASAAQHTSSNQNSAAGGNHAAADPGTTTNDGKNIKTAKELENLEAAVDEVFGKASGPGVNADNLVSDLRAELHKAKRDEEFISQDMYDDIKKLLYAFGVPYVEAPSEAEAQCAFLVESKLAQCVVSDDSDVVVFSAKSGSTRVYRHLFSSKGDAEKYTSFNISQHLGLAYDDLIALAMLLGCDYTVGVKGIGIVNALEILQAFGAKRFVEEQTASNQNGGALQVASSSSASTSGIIPEVDQHLQTAAGTSSSSGVAFDWLTELRHLKEWAQDVANFDNKEYFDAAKIPADFHKKHRALRPYWVFPPDFPSVEVWNAFQHPVVDHSKEKFVWGGVDVDRITTIVGRYMTDALVLRTLDITRLNEMQQQRRQEDYLKEFFTFEDEQPIAMVRSKRLQLAIRRMRKANGDDVEEVEAAPATQGEVEFLEDDSGNHKRQGTAAGSSVAGGPGTAANNPGGKEDVFALLQKTTSSDLAIAASKKNKKAKAVGAKQKAKGKAKGKAKASSGGVVADTLLIDLDSEGEEEELVRSSPRPEAVPEPQQENTVPLNINQESESGNGNEAASRSAAPKQSAKAKSKAKSKARAKAKASGAPEPSSQNGEARSTGSAKQNVTEDCSKANAGIPKPIFPPRKKPPAQKKK